jgi:hypothetical protein
MSRRRGARQVWAVAATALLVAGCAPQAGQASSRVAVRQPGGSTTTTTATTPATAPPPRPGVGLAAAINEKLLTPTGGVVSYFQDGRQENPDENGVGHERLSESSGLLLAHAVAVGDRDLFRLAADFYRAHLRSGVGLAYWKLDANDQPVRSRDEGSYSSAPNDELRIIRTLLAGVSLTGDARYDTDARAAGKALLAGVREGILTDDVSWDPQPPTPGDRVEVDYLDVAGMRSLATAEPRWADVAGRALDVLRRAVQPDGPPRQFFDFQTGRYSCEAGRCPTIAGLYSGLRLENGGDRDAAQTVYRYYVDRLDRDGSLAGSYTTAGVSAERPDLAGYALLARLAARLGDGERARTIITRWVEPHRQASGPVAGLYSDDPNDASAFVNLELLATFDELEGHRPAAD